MNNHGLILKPVEPEHFKFGDGRLGDVPVNPSGDWTNFLPIPENQNFGMEPYACTSFALLNCVETLIRQEYEDTINFSDRFLAFISGTGAQKGNDPHNVAEVLRLKGDVIETDWPYTHDLSFEQFYSTPPQTLYIESLLFTSGYEFGHSWVTSNPTQMMSALKYSPLSAGVYAWIQDPITGYYVNPDNILPEHDVMVFGYKQGEYWLIFDSYDQNIKKLAWNFPFSAIKRYTLHRKTVKQALPVWQTILNYCLAQLLIIKSKLGFS